MNRSVLCLYEINKKFTLGPQKFLLFKGGESEGGCEYIMVFRLLLRGGSAGSGLSWGVGYGYYFLWRNCG